MPLPGIHAKNNGTLEAPVTLAAREAIIASRSPAPVAIAVEPEVIIADETTQVIESLETFETAFKDDSLKAEYVAFAETARALFDPTDLAKECVELGRLGQNLMVAEKTARPSAYDRATIVQKMETAFRIAGVPSGRKPQEILACYWVAKLDQSTVDEEGKIRSFPAMLDPEWFGGNISFEALRKLASLISRASGKDDVDVWEYATGREQFSRSMVTKLRNCELSTRQLDALIKHRKAKLSAAKSEAKQTATQKKDLGELALGNAKEKTLVELGSLVTTMAEHAITACGKDKPGIKDYLVNKGVIPADVALSVEGFARVMTAADAKVLVQELMTLAPSNPDRAAVLAALLAECNAAQVKLAKDQAEAKPELKKAG